MDMSLDIKDLAALFELSRDAILGEENGIVRLVNPAAKAFLGAKEGDAAEAYFPPDIVRSPMTRFVASGIIRGRSMTISVTRQNGLSLYIVPRQENLNDPVPEGAAAELGTLLMTERMALDRLVKLADNKDDESAAQLTSILYRTHYRAKRLQEHLAMASLLRRNALPYEPRLLTLGDIVSDTVSTTQSLTAKTGITLLQDCDEGCHIRGDRHLIEVLLFNLLSNSFLHTKYGGTIRVTLKRRDRYCILGVDDTGDGISSLRLSDLLPDGAAPIMTDPSTGAGLGLSLARGIAELHNGALILESFEDAGTRLRISFPLLSPEESLLLREPDPQRADGLDLALTELSGVLDRDIYTRRMFD